MMQFMQINQTKKCQHRIPACGVNGVEVIRCRELCKKM